MSEELPPYPKEILPDINYKLKIEEEHLTAESSGLVIQRATEHEVDILTPEDFGDKYLHEMSVNVMGGKFLKEHVCWSPYKPTLLPTEVPFSNEYRYNERMHGIYLKIFPIHNKTFPSYRSFPNKELFEKHKDAIVDATESFSSSKIYEERFMMKVEHRPTNANYWHCQIEIAPDWNEIREIVKKEKAKWERDALKAMTNVLVGVAYENPALNDSFPKIKEEWYVNIEE